MTKLFLGIDTSNYTTSLSAVLTDGSYYNVKVPLCVKPHERGVRQSDAVFMHTKNLPQSFDELFEKVRNDNGEDLEILAVGTSTRPRRVDGSYMPCFLSGVAVAKSISASHGVPLYEFSHQEGHIMSALFGAHLEVPDRFYSFHLSGGTTELLFSQKRGFGFDTTIISESADITLGQLVDRTGVMMGLNFPAGKALEELALLSKKSEKIKIGGKEKINLSGFENKVQKMYSENAPKEEVAGYVFDVVFEAVKAMLSARDDTSLPVVFSGGVSSSTILKKRAKEICSAYFAPPELSADNAVGIALLTKEKYIKVNKDEQ